MPGAMEEKVNITQIEIMGESYTITTEDDPAYVVQVARYVDAKFREMKNTSPGSSFLRIAVLVALNIADELHKMKSRDQGKEKEIEDKMNRIFALLEKEMSGRLSK